MRPSTSLKMKRYSPSLEQVMKTFSTAWIISLSLAQNDESKIHPCLGNVQRNWLDLPQTMSDFPVMDSAWSAVDQVTEDMEPTEKKPLS